MVRVITAFVSMVFILGCPAASRGGLVNVIVHGPGGGGSGTIDPNDPNTADVMKDFTSPLKGQPLILEFTTDSGGNYTFNETITNNTPFAWIDFEWVLSTPDGGDTINGFANTDHQWDNNNVDPTGGSASSSGGNIPMGGSFTQTLGINVPQAGTYTVVETPSYPEAVPEPSSIVLGTGLLIVAGCSWYRGRKARG